jgi:Protein of unknown function (DUF2510)
MAKGPGWYPDPWGETGLRWWDGTNWTEHVQGQPVAGYAPGPVIGGGPLMTSPDLRKWYHEWWFILVMLFLCCWPLGLILTWTRPSTPTSFKIGVTVGYFVFSAMLGLAFYALFPELYQTGPTQ